MRTLKIVGAVALAMLLAVAGGWAWGRSGRAGMEQRLAACDLRLRLTDAKSRILGGRVDLYSLNFGAAAQNFDAAHAVVDSILATYDPAGTSARAAHLKTVQSQLADAKRMAGQMRQDAHVQADRALQALAAAAQAAEDQ